MTLFTKTTRWAAILTCTATVGLVAVSGCKSDASAPEAKQMMMSSDKDIIQTATGPNMEQVTTLVKAVQAAGLVDTLRGPRPVHRLRPDQRRLRGPAPGHRWTCC